MSGPEHAKWSDTTTITMLCVLLIVAQVLATVHLATHDMLEADGPCEVCQLAVELKHPIPFVACHWSPSGEGRFDGLCLSTSKVTYSRSFDPRAPPFIFI